MYIQRKTDKPVKFRRQGQEVNTQLPGWLNTAFLNEKDDRDGLDCIYFNRGFKPQHDIERVSYELSTLVISKGMALVDYKYEADSTSIKMKNRHNGDTIVNLVILNLRLGSGKTKMTPSTWHVCDVYGMDNRGKFGCPIVATTYDGKVIILHYESPNHNNELDGKYLVLTIYPNQMLCYLLVDTEENLKALIPHLLKAKYVAINSMPVFYDELQIMVASDYLAKKFT